MAIPALALVPLLAAYFALAGAMLAKRSMTS
jgi:hypothetical protein